jgi:hypothetical protein
VLYGTAGTCWRGPRRRGVAQRRRLRWRRRTCRRIERGCAPLRSPARQRRPRRD